MKDEEIKFIMNLLELRSYLSDIAKILNDTKKECEIKHDEKYELMQEENK